MAEIQGLPAAEMNEVYKGVVGEKRGAQQAQRNGAEGGDSLVAQDAVERDQKVAHCGQQGFHARYLSKTVAETIGKPLCFSMLER